MRRGGDELPWSWCRTITSRWRLELIRRRLPLSTIIAFWHIPWPRACADFDACPMGRQLLTGCSAAASSDSRRRTTAGTSSIPSSCSLDAQHRPPPRYSSHTADATSMVRAYPVSVEWPSRWPPSRHRSRRAARRSGRQLGLAPDVRLGVGVDRLDYTKGIIEKLLAVERLLEPHPEHIGALCLRADCRTEQTLPAGLSRAPIRAVGDGGSDQRPLWSAAAVRSSCSRPIMIRRRSTDSCARRISVTSGACTTE